MNDSEIIKGLECCTLLNGCNDCPYVDKSAGRCSAAMVKDALGLIKRQQTEIDRLNIDLKVMRGAANSWKAEVQRICKKEFDNIGIDIEAVKSEAVKEFAGKLAIKLAANYSDKYCHWIDDTIYELVEEMGCNDEL